MRRWYHAIACLMAAAWVSVLLCAGPALGADAPLSGNGIAAAARQLDGIARLLDRTSVTPSLSQLEAWATQANTAKSRADRCLADLIPVAGSPVQGNAGAGQLGRGFPVGTTGGSEILRQERLTQDARLAACQQLTQHAGRLLRRIGQKQRALLAARFFAHGATFVGLLQDNWGQPQVWARSTATFLLRHSGVARLAFYDLWMLGVLGVVAVAAGILLRRRLARWVADRHWSDGFSGGFAMSLAASIARYLPYLLVSATVAAILGLALGDHRPLPFLALAAYGLPAYFLALVAIRLFLVPTPPARPFITLPSRTARTLARRFRVLALFGYVGFLGIGILVVQSLPTPALLLARGIFFVGLTLNILWVVWPIMQIGRLSRLRGLRVLLALVLVGAILAEILGYRNLSVAVLRFVTGTLLVSGLMVLAICLVNEFFDQLDAGHSSWRQRLRQSLDLGPGQPIPGLVWLRVTTLILLWAALLLVLVRTWGLSNSALTEVRSYVVGGFLVGSLRIFPVRVLLALVTFVLLFVSSEWVRARLRRRWLGKPHLEPGALEAMVTISGYVGTSIAVVVALSVAGLGFSNLAIIAGALSVGIGFGMQNIVNNFVSGLILLFERPIKTGDWIVVGGTEGFVRHIRIRSTQIQTFDRADVIVPNSELISGQVTNWMLRDPGGRVHIPVGVAYGSDTGLVKELLLKIGTEHPQVIRDDPDRTAKVFFLSFGDSSLNFELQCHISHIGQRMQVISDMNFTIDAEFRKHGIEMPFPQRDIHVRDLPPGWNEPAPRTPDGR